MVNRSLTYIVFGLLWLRVSDIRKHLSAGFGVVIAFVNDVTIVCHCGTRWVTQRKPYLWATQRKLYLWATQRKPYLWATQRKPYLWATQRKPSLWATQRKPSLWATQRKPYLWAVQALSTTTVCKLHSIPQTQGDNSESMSTSLLKTCYTLLHKRKPYVSHTMLLPRHSRVYMSWTITRLSKCPNRKWQRTSVLLVFTRLNFAMPPIHLQTTRHTANVIDVERV